jgi:RNA polymerase sigma-70 factor (ECF subfamily)
MVDPLDEVGKWLPEAQAGSGEALGQVLQACRGYLLLIAQEELDPALRAKAGASDLVQQTFLEAQRDFGCFRGEPRALLAWMRQMLRNNLANFRRDYGRAKRCVQREVALGENWLQAANTSPSVSVMLREETQALEQAVQRLPEDFRRVIHLRYREEHSFEGIAKLMRRSPTAVRRLWSRAIEQLKQELEAS